MIKKRIDKNVKRLILEAERSTRIAVAAIGFAMFGIAVPTFIDLTELATEGKWIFVVSYFILGFLIMVEQGIKLRSLKKEIDQFDE